MHCIIVVSQQLKNYLNLLLHFQLTRVSWDPGKASFWVCWSAEERRAGTCSSIEINHETAEWEGVLLCVTLGGLRKRLKISYLLAKLNELERFWRERFIADRKIDMSLHNPTQNTQKTRTRSQIEMKESSMAQADAIKYSQMPRESDEQIRSCS